MAHPSFQKLPTDWNLRHIRFLHTYLSFLPRSCYNPHHPSFRNAQECILSSFSYSTTGNQDIQSHIPAVWADTHNGKVFQVCLVYPQWSSQISTGPVFRFPNRSQVHPLQILFLCKQHFSNSRHIHHQIFRKMSRLFYEFAFHLAIILLFFL